MRVSRSLEDPVFTGKEKVGVTIGNFDGLHVGHLRLFSVLDEKLRAIAPKTGTPVRRGVITFAPHPRAFFRGITHSELKSAPELWPVMPLRAKLGAFERLGLDFVSLLRFDRKLASLPAPEFLEKVLVKALGVSVVVVGHDWAFGKAREGNVALLRSFGESHGFSTHIVDPVIISGVRVSTTTVKEALIAGDLRKLSQLLGRRFTLTAHVTHGERRGHMLGFPTANLHLPNQVLPGAGVYATRVLWRGKSFASATNVGIRPTFGGVTPTVEVHLLDSGEVDLYQERIEVEFVERLREERRFASAEELKAAIRDDIDRARRILADPHAG